ncbi:MAG TPA: hypothetical protein VFC17_04575 [Candidatus Limnocylindrales bacterium]|nr:hypothetical protein [Candidatus Limnocylindrales bacterium]
MKLSTQWKPLNRDQRLAWNAWAKSNQVLLDDGSFRRVSGHKAMTMILRNRTLAGDALNPASPPAAATWLDGVLTLSECGPLTAGAGYIGFRAGAATTVATKWFVWATAPVLTTDLQPLATLCFIAALNCGALAQYDITANLGGSYLPIHGDWHPPVDLTQNTPHWNPPRNIWLRLHQYVDGQLSPGRMFCGGIYDED